MVRLADLGEKAVVASILAGIKSTAAVGPGDDAAAVEVGDKYVVASSDLVSRIAHLPKGMTDWQIGWFAAAVNLSDIAAMGARPLGLLLSFCLPRDTYAADLERMVRGAQDCAESVGTEILGGDTKEGEQMVIAGTALGVVDKDRIILRRGAREGDLLAVTGTMGLAAAGYQAAAKGAFAPSAVKALLEPTPRIKEGMALASTGAVTSGMDVTDGLAYSVHELSRQSGVKFRVHWESIPVDDTVKRVADKTRTRVEDLVLYYGGDYELLFTIRPEMLEKVREAVGDAFTVIGKVDGDENVLIREGEVVTLEPRGYEHFKG